MVEITAKGDHTIKAIGINPEVVDPEDVEMLEDMLLAAFNEAMRQIDEESERELEKVTGGLNIPGLSSNSFCEIQCHQLLAVYLYSFAISSLSFAKNLKLFDAVGANIVRLIIKNKSTEVIK